MRSNCSPTSQRNELIHLNLIGRSAHTVTSSPSIRISHNSSPVKFSQNPLPDSLARSCCRLTSSTVGTVVQSSDGVSLERWKNPCPPITVPFLLLSENVLCGTGVLMLLNWNKEKQCIVTVEKGLNSLVWFYLGFTIGQNRSWVFMTIIQGKNDYKNILN